MAGTWLRIVGVAALVAASACKTTGGDAGDDGTSGVASDSTLRERLYDIRDGIQSVLDKLDTAAFVLREGILPAMHAKEVCSCYFTAGLKDKPSCDRQVNMYVTMALVETRVTDDPPGIVAVQRLKVSSTDLARLGLPSRPIYYVARYAPGPDGHGGCSLVAKGEGEPPSG